MGSKAPTPAPKQDRSPPTDEHLEDRFTRAFSEWERRYREEPEKFQSDFERFTKETPDSYGRACAKYFIELI